MLKQRVHIVTIGVYRVKLQINLFFQLFKPHIVKYEGVEMYLHTLAALSPRNTLSTN
jgi:hypothetical protein